MVSRVGLHVKVQSEEPQVAALVVGVVEVTAVGAGEGAAGFAPQADVPIRQGHRLVRAQGPADRRGEQKENAHATLWPGVLEWAAHAVQALRVQGSISSPLWYPRARSAR